jgi:hypothetical protein
MKLSKLFVIALLAGTLAVIGCDDGNGNGNGGTGGDGNGGTGGDGNGGTGGDGNGGTGGTADACTTGDCADSSTDVQGACGTVKTFCNSEDCCTLPGTGGTGGTMTIDPDSDTCDDVGQVACILGAGGAGGNGGEGGTGGTVPAECDWTAAEICLACELQGGIQDCENEFVACLLADLGGNECEKCAVLALAECFE